MGCFGAPERAWGGPDPPDEFVVGPGGGQISGLGSLGGDYGGEQSHTPRDPQGVGGLLTRRRESLPRTARLGARVRSGRYGGEYDK